MNRLFTWLAYYSTETSTRLASSKLAPPLTSAGLRISILDASIPAATSASEVDFARALASCPFLATLPLGS